jgi:hypothetical protein
LAQGSSAEAHEESHSRVRDEAGFFVEGVAEVLAVVAAAVAAAVAERLELMMSLAAPSGGGVPTWWERALDEE